MIALLAGATGLVGQSLLNQLLADPRYTQVHCIGRRIPDVQHTKLHTHIVDFANLPMSSTGLPTADDVYIALGTTIKVAGSQAAFRAIDFDSVLAVAHMNNAQAATKSIASLISKRIGIVSAMGADAQSAVFYSRVKGEMEAAVAKLGYASTVFARPSMLAGNREALSQATRPGEQIGLALMRPFKWLIPTNYHVIEASQVAKALIHLVTHAAPGVQVALSGELQKI